MKKIILIVMICVSFSSFAKVDASKVYGRIQIVDQNPDYKVKVVDRDADLRVLKHHVPRREGVWDIVESSPDYKIQIVNDTPNSPDFTIEYVSSLAKLDAYKVYGKIKIVDEHEDYKVKVVTDNADLKVQKTYIATSVGKWEIVDDFPDYKIKIVDDFPDFTIKYVDRFPGVN